jgi:hypothetical protein
MQIEKGEKRKLPELRRGMMTAESLRERKIEN